VDIVRGVLWITAQGENVEAKRPLWCKSILVWVGPWVERYLHKCLSPRGNVGRALNKSLEAFFVCGQSPADKLELPNPNRDDTNVFVNIYPGLSKEIGGSKHEQTR